MESTVFAVIALAFLVPSAFLWVYNVLLALVAVLRPRSGRASRTGAPPLRFALVMPAHDEEETIGATLEACLELDHPRELFDVFVIADNCTDGTAEVARRHGVHCLERHDLQERGKGFALRWAFDQLLEQPYDAYVVLDADCILDPGALGAFSAEMAAGHPVLQADYVVANPDASPISYALAVGNAIENDLYYAPKSILGLVVSLRGTGMAFRRDVLERFPWGAYSIVEDLDYSMSLYRNGLRVRHLPDVAVRSDFPETVEQLTVQRTRWAGGNVQMGKGDALRLLGEAFRERRPILADMALTILSQSRPLQLLLAGGAWGSAGLGLLLAGGAFLEGLFAAAIVVLVGTLAYLASGILRLGIDGRRLRLLLSVPGVVFRLVWILVRSLLAPSEGAWARTPRS